MRPSRFRRFIDARNLTLAELARESGRHRRWLSLLALGKAQPTAKTIAAVVKAARIATGDRSIKANDLFPLDDDD